MILDHYIIKKFFSNFLFILISFTVIFIIVDIIDNIDKFINRGIANNQIIDSPAGILRDVTSTVAVKISVPSPVEYSPATHGTVAPSTITVVFPQLPSIYHTHNNNNWAAEMVAR